jgi:hypothetical protein
MGWGNRCNYSKVCAVAVVGMVLLGDFTFKRCGSSNGCGVADGHQIRTSTITATLFEKLNCLFFS